MALLSYLDGLEPTCRTPLWLVTRGGCEDLPRCAEAGSHLTPVKLGSGIPDGSSPAPPSAAATVTAGGPGLALQAEGHRHMPTLTSCRLSWRLLPFRPLLWSCGLSSFVTSGISAYLSLQLRVCDLLPLRASCFLLALHLYTLWGKSHKLGWPLEADDISSAVLHPSGPWGTPR